jgi:hypothetical protein
LDDASCNNNGRDASYFGTELKGAELTPGDGARIGATDFDTWVATRPQGVGL